MSYLVVAILLLVAMVIAGVWVASLIDALRSHRPWPWVIFLAFVPVISTPIYLFNYYVLGKNREGFIDKTLSNSARINALKAEVEANDLIGDIRELAFAYYDAQSYRESLKYLQRALDFDGEDTRAQYIAAQCFLALKMPTQSLPHFEYVLEVEPRYLQGAARLGYAKALYLSGETERYQLEIARAASHFNLPEASVMYARNLISEGKREEAYQVLIESLKTVGELSAEQKLDHKIWIKTAAEDLAKLKKGK